MNKKTLICKSCNKTFKVFNYRINAKFCSSKCYWKNLKGLKRPERQKRVTKKCVICNKNFIVRNCHNRVKTCSIKCGGLLRRGQKWELKDRINKKCIGCENIMRILPSKGYKLFCSRKCFISFKTKNVKYPDRQRFQGSSWEKIRKIIIKRDKVCIDCEKKGAEVHHIIPYSITGDNSLENLVLLCKSCHLKRHLKLWQKEKSGSMTRLLTVLK